MLMRSTRWGAVLLLGLLLLLSAAASAEDGGDGLSETAEDWDDVLDALEPFHREEAELCAACTFVSDRINAKWTRHAYKLKKWSAKKKLKKARRAVKKACKGIAKSQMCKSGMGAKTKFEDFNVLMQRGSISNVNMASHYATELQTLCDTVTARILDFVPEKMADVERIFDYKLEKDLCHRIVPTCGKKKLKSRGGAASSASARGAEKQGSEETEREEAEVETNEDSDTETIEL